MQRSLQMVDSDYLSHTQQTRIREIKRELCSLIKSVAIRKNWTQKHLAAHLGISEQYAGYIVKCYTSKVSFNHLFEVLVLIEPNFRMMITLDVQFTRTIPPANWPNY